MELEILANSHAAYGHLSELLRYPGEGCVAEAQSCARALAEDCPAASAAVRRFVDEMSGRSVDEMEEAHIRVFDWNPHCALEIGWHLFGEDYNRGAFLVKMRDELRTLGIDERGELPDHLTLVLLVLEKMDPVRAEEFKRACVLPAVEIIIKGLDRVDRTPYRHILEAVRLFLGGANSLPEEEK